MLKRARWILGLLSLFISLQCACAEPPLTVAERSNYTAGSRHAEVVAFCEQLAKESPLVRLGELGTSHEGRKLPLLIVADPPVANAQAAAASGQLVVFAMGNIHAGEIDGKEALLMLARDLALAKDRPLLKDLVLVFAPIFNADGNDKMGKNRLGQAGPPLVGTRANAQGFDLNRDFVKLESPEVRALVRFLNQWDPAIFIDCHTTNGSYHRYAITYEGGRCPAGDPKVIEFTRDVLLPDVGKRMEQTAGLKSYFYGNFSADRSRWETVSPTPRYGTHYIGLRNRIAVLSESYSYAPYKERVLASKAFVQSIFEFAAENKDKIRQLIGPTRSDPALAEAPKAGPGKFAGKSKVFNLGAAGRTVSSAEQAKNVDLVLRQQPAPFGRPVNILGFVEEKQGDRRVPTTKPRDYEAVYMGGVEPTLTVRRPYAYLFPATLTQIVENLQRHGIEVEELREDIELDVEVYKTDGIARAPEFQKHKLVTLQASMRNDRRRLPAGTILVRTAQPLGNLAAYLLEPQAADGLATWNFFDAVLAQDQDFPVLRLPLPTPITAGRVRPLAENRKMDQPIVYDPLTGGRTPNFVGSPIGSIQWLGDGEHFLQVKDGQLLKVEALTGRSQPFFDPDKLAQGLASLPGIGPKMAPTLARSPFLRMNPQRTAALFERDSDLYYCKLDGTGAVRLTKSPGAKELTSFSPDGKYIAFVHKNNLHVVNIATQTERALTTDGSDVIFNGKADWVYFEEIFLRTHQAYWWSPDSTALVFMRIDDAPVRPYTVVNPTTVSQTLETTPYPKAGAPNPNVKLGIVTVAGNGPSWVDLNGQSATATLIIGAGWLPDSQRVYFYVQDRAQTWLDFCTAARNGGASQKLFRDTTKAWVDDPGPPHFLKDGSFLLPSERTGYKHLYRFAADGKLLGPVTSGNWEARTLHLVDEAGGWVCFSGMRDDPIAANLYRVKLDGSGLERLTEGAGDHKVTVSPKGNLFVDSSSNHAAPTQARLVRTDKSLARTLDTNPVYALEEYRRGAFELVRIPTPDGFTLRGSILKPPTFDPAKRYPVWFMTYAGPHAPTVHDNWGNGRAKEEMLAQMGFVVFRCDPRSASGQGACSTWTAYRQLGVQEMKDIETAIGWLNKHSYVDPARIGMSGASYGGFMTAYALTHSKLFAAGIAAAPVTDWHNYDSIYTERYMNTPQENPEGYKVTSVVAAAGKLHGKLLLVHGMMDDNVHAQNSMQLIDALQKANKQFEVMVYPHNRHGFGGPHYERLTIDFMKRVLRPE
jgi:dipeptidyl aminopeptidase/acylaminoacyl peptidase